MLCIYIGSGKVLWYAYTYLVLLVSAYVNGEQWTEMLAVNGLVSERDSESCQLVIDQSAYGEMCEIIRISHQNVYVHTYQL